MLKFFPGTSGKRTMQLCQYGQVHMTGPGVDGVGIFPQAGKWFRLTFGTFSGEIKYYFHIKHPKFTFSNLKA